MDGAIALAITVAAAIPFTYSDSAGDEGGGLWVILAVALCTIYYAATMCRGGERNGQTLGKQAVGLRVTRTDGKPIGPGVVLFRELLLKLVVGWLTGIGWLIDGLWPLHDGENRAVHDLAAGTRVVSDPPRVPAPVAAPPRALAPDIQRYLTEARAAQARIRDAVQRAELPYMQVCREVDSLLIVMQRSAQRAQLLHEALADTPVALIEGRLNELAGSGRRELADALGQQLEVQRRLQAQLERFGDEMARIVVELATIRGSLLSVSASTDAGNQQRLADRVRGLRDEMSAVATGMSVSFD
jgi:uncharacterized RDD family membrane protein YckC